MKKLILITLTVILFSSCKDNDNYDVDISDVEVSINVKHFEKDLFKFTIDSSDHYLNLYRDTYGEFFKLFNFQIVEIGSSEHEKYPENLDMFVRYWNEEGLPEVLNKEFPNFETEQLPEIEKAFKYYKYYFPENLIPEIYTFFSSFGYSVVTIENIIGLALDKYLGKEYFHFYDKVGWSQYQKRRMIKEMIPVDLMRSVAESDHPFEMTDTDNLLDNIIYEGKIQYFLNCVLPETPDTLKWRYTAKQMSWAQRHEKRIWNYIADQQLLFTTDKLEIRKFTGDGPYTSIFTDVSAPRAGSYVGFKIVESYMKNNSNVSLKELMEDPDSRTMLAEAKYNP